MEDISSAFQNTAGIQATHFIIGVLGGGHWVSAAFQLQIGRVGRIGENGCLRLQEFRGGELSENHQQCYQWGKMSLVSIAAFFFLVFPPFTYSPSLPLSCLWHNVSLPIACQGHWFSPFESIHSWLIWTPFLPRPGLCHKHIAMQSLLFSLRPPPSPHHYQSGN